MKLQNEGGKEMVGILVATHGGFAEGILNAVELLAGKPEKVKTVGLYHGDGIDEFCNKVDDAIESLDDGDGVLAFVDILGGSPSNAVMKCFSHRENLKAITGVNMAMLIQAVMMREGTELEELCSICMDAGRDAQVLLHEKYAEMVAEAAKSEEEDEF